MCKNLVQKGKLEKPLILYNRTASRTVALNTRIGHSTVAETVEEAVLPADIIFSCLTDEAAVNQIFDRIFKLEIKGKLFVECSTVLAAHMDDLSERVQAAGANFIAMPGMRRIPLGIPNHRPKSNLLFRVSVWRTDHGRSWLALVYSRWPP